MLGNRYDLFCLLAGVVSSAFVVEFFQKLIITCIVMLISTTIAFFWRRYLHVKMRERIKRNKK